MPFPTTVVEVLQLLRDGREADLAGVEESQWLEVKGAPYTLTKDDRQKWELAKDVSALANSGGGMILIAALTERPEAWYEEKITAIKAVPAKLVDLDQYRKVLAGWTFPPVGPFTELVPFERDAGSRLVAIVVKPVSDDEQPVMVRTKVPIGSEVIEVWSIARRVGTGTEWIPSQVVWSDIRDGRLARRSLGRVSPAEADATFSQPVAADL